MMGIKEFILYGLMHMIHLIVSSNKQTVAINYVLQSTIYRQRGVR